MLTISLDEQGEFEQETNHNDNKGSLPFIGGIIYDDQGFHQDFYEERKRISLYLQAVCQEVQASYPQDLHVNHDNSNHSKVRAVKQKLTETFSEFLRDGKCQFENNAFAFQLNNKKPRKGKYYIFVYLKYGTENLFGDTTSILVRENYASNLYIQMATEVIERIVFHNPVIEDCNEISLDLATRRFAVTQEIKEKEFRNLGYNYIKKEESDEREVDEEDSNGEKVYYSISNADVYRTALRNEMLNTENNRINIKGFHVRSIYYGQNEDNNEESDGDQIYEDSEAPFVHENNPYLKMSFLYLADIVCSIIGYQPDKSSPEKLIEGFKNKADELLGHEDNLIFAYDKVDFIFKNAWKAVEQEDYYEALDLAYKGKTTKSPYAEFYTKTWFQRLKKRLSERTDASAYGLATRKFYMSTRTNDLKQDELFDVFETLKSMKENVKFKYREDYESIYDLYDGAMAAFNHYGDSKDAEECFLQCKSYAKYVSTERYFRTRNKRVVFLMDSFQYEEALDFAKENVDLQEELKALRGLAVDEEELSKNYGIALSQLGQVYALLHDSNGEQIFLDAMEQLEPGTFDYMQTLSYLLHYYIDMGEKEKYDAAAREYFGNESNLKKQLTHIIREGEKGDNAIFSMKYALYFYVKGLYVFHMDDIDRSAKLLDCLCDIERTIRETDKGTAVDQINNHPWEIIYKYLALIALKKDRKDEASKYLEKSLSVFEHTDFILQAICLFGECEYAKEAGNNEIQKERINQLSSLFLKNKIEIYDEINWQDTESAYSYLKNNVMTFMYS